MILLLVYGFVALGASFLCSLLEASLLSIPRSYVAVQVERGSTSGKRLERMKSDIDRPLAAILTLNTFAHTLGAAGVGSQATVIWGEAWVGAVSVFVTILILVFSEIIPKTLGAIHAKRLASFTAWTTHWLIFLLTPIVAICNAVSRMVSGGEQGAKLSREEVHGMARLGQTEGVLNSREGGVIRNLMALREIQAHQVMTPRSVVVCIDHDRTVSQATEGGPPRFARIPVIDGSIDNVLGLIHRYELFDSLRSGRGDIPVAKLMRPIHTIKQNTGVAAVLESFLRRREQLLIVEDESDRVVGIITLEDVMETLLGTEIVDETDDVVDMRELAERLIAGHQASRSSHGG